MAVKTYVDSAGLQRYNQKWHEWIEGMEFTNLVIDSILDQIFPPRLSFTVNTQATSSGERKTGIPVNLYNLSGITVTVDWGDETTSTLTSANYTQTDSNASVHEYASPGIYTVNIDSSDWEQTYLFQTQYEIETPRDADIAVYWYRRTLTAVNELFPKLKGIRIFNSSSATSLMAYVNAFCSCFNSCTKLKTIPSGLFDRNGSASDFSLCFFLCESLEGIPDNLFTKNVNASTFASCFYGCSSISSIPSSIFKGAAWASNFYNCFAYCSSLQAIPSGLFENCTGAANFMACFSSCASIQAIPESLFENCISANNFSMCFSNCTGLSSIPSNLFAAATAMTTCSECFYNCTNVGNFSIHIGSSSVTSASYFITLKSGTTRTVYVPSGSTTKTTFDGIASTYGLTIIGE